jgi:O-antigen/teichoic acid export membrane protein
MTGSHSAGSADTDSPKGRRGSYRAGFFFGTLSFGVAIGLGFASTVLTARLYGVETIGDFALVWAPVAALWVLSTIKEQQALIKEIAALTPREPRVTQLFAAVFTFSLGLTATMALVATLVCCFVFPGPLNAPQLLAPALVSIAGYTLVTNTGWNFDSILSAFVAGRQLFHVRLNESISFIVLVTAFGLTWKSVWGLVIATIGASAIALVHRAVVARRFAVPRLNRSEYRKGLRVLPGLLRFGLKAAPGQIALGISQQGGIWAVGIVAPVAAVGAFSRAMVIPKNVQQASMRVTEVLFPTLVGRHSAGDGHGFDRALIDSIRYEVIGMLLLAAALGGAAHSVLDIFGPGFSAAVPALVLLLFFPVLASISITQTQALWAVDRPGLTSIVAMARLAVTIVLLVVLTPTMNFAGPALALLAGMLVSVVLFGLALRRHLTRPLRSTWPLRERATLVVAYAAGFGAAHAVEQAAPSLAALPLCLAAGTLAYVAVLVLGGGVNRRDRERIGVLRARLRSRMGKGRWSRTPRAAVLSLALLAATLAWGASSANAYVYWSDDDDAGGSLGRAELSGGANPGDGWLPGLASSCGIAVDGSHVYWTTREGTVGRANLDGSAVDEDFIALPSGWACGVAVDAGHLYWASNSSGKLGRAALDGSSVQAAWMSPGTGHGCGIAVDATSVYWATASGVYSAPLGGGPASTISEATTDNCGVAVNAAHIYWATGEGWIERDTLGGGPPTPIVEVPLSPCGVAVDANYLYWANSASDTIGRSNLDGSGVDQRFAEGARHPCGVAVDSLGSSSASRGPAATPPAPPSNMFRLGQVRKNKRRGTARLEILLPGPGTVVLAGRKVIERRVAEDVPGGKLTPVEIKVKPRRRTRGLLATYGVVVAPLSVTFTPAGGFSRTRYTRVWLALAGKPRRTRTPSRPYPTGCRSIFSTCRRSQGKDASNWLGYLPSK